MATTKLTGQELVAANNAISQLANEDLPYKAAYAIMRTAQKIEGEHKAIMDTRRSIIRKHAKKDGDDIKQSGGQIEWKQGGEAKANAEIRDLMQEEVEVEYHSFDRLLLSNEPGLRIKAAQLYSLDFMFDESAATDKVHRNGKATAEA